MRVGTVLLLACAGHLAVGATVRADIYQDFSVTELSIVPQGSAGFLVKTSVAIVPGGQPPSQPLTLRLVRSGSMLVAETDVILVGQLSADCCPENNSDMCKQIDGYTITCTSSCPNSSLSTVCTYNKSTSFSGLPLGGEGSLITAILDPDHQHQETAPGATSNNALTATVPPNIPGGGVFSDFGITGLRVQATGGGKYRIETQVHIGPEVISTGLPIEITISSSPETLVAQGSVETDDLGVQICCHDACPSPPGENDTVACSGACTDPAQVGGPGIRGSCVYTRRSVFEGVPLLAGSELVACLDRNGLHTETAVDAAANNCLSVVVPGGNGVAIPTLSDENLLVLALLTLASGIFLLWRRTAQVRG